MGAMPLSLLHPQHHHHHLVPLLGWQTRDTCLDSALPLDRFLPYKLGEHIRHLLPAEHIVGRFIVFERGLEPGAELGTRERILDGRTSSRTDELEHRRSGAFPST